MKTNTRLGSHIVRIAAFCFSFSVLTFSLPAFGSDWIHWRGPEMNGQANEPAVPATFELGEAGKNGLLWKAPVGGRSSPLVMNGLMFTINAYDPGLLTEGERITCFDATTGEVKWHYNVNVYHAEVVTSRLGWTTLTADPDTGNIFAHTTAGALLCLNREGKVVWQRHLSEEFGRFTGYGGRIVSPICDSGLVIVAIVNSSWGDQARGGNRFIAFDCKTGLVAWISEPSIVNKGTYQSHPIVAVIGGQRLLIAGGASGDLHALKVRTGEKVWSYLFSSGPINPAPVVDGNLVYSAHGEENPEGGAIGRVICVDASQVVNGKPKLVWEFRRSNRFGLSHPALADGRLYVPDDGGELFCFNAKTGKLLWRQKYGTVSRGAPLINNGKLYIFDVNAKLMIFKLKGDQKPDEDETEEHTFKVPAGVTGFVETHATPIAVNGKLYFTTSFETYCIGAKEDAKPGAYKPLPAEAEFKPDAEPAAVMVSPAEINCVSGDEVKLKLKFLDANGREVKAPADAKIAWELVTPTPPKGSTITPPPLKAELAPNGVDCVVKLIKMPWQQGVVSATLGKLKAAARIRVVPQIPLAQDFESIPEGAPPAGWVNAGGKFIVKDLGGNKVLSKVNTDGRIPIARANGYITATNSTGYTIETDIMAREVEGRLPDMGLVANRYSLVMDGKVDTERNNQRTLRIVSWEARPRVNQAVVLHWKPETWYRMKLTVEVGEKSAVIRGKVWEKGQPEPDKWTVEFDDPSPNREGAAALYGYVPGITNRPGAEIYYDNVSIVPNKK